MSRPPAGVDVSAIGSKVTGRGSKLLSSDLRRARWPQEGGRERRSLQSQPWALGAETGLGCPGWGAVVVASTYPRSKEVLSKVYPKLLLLKLYPSLQRRQFLKPRISFSVFYKRCVYWRKMRIWGRSLRRNVITSSCL